MHYYLTLTTLGRGAGGRLSMSSNGSLLLLWKLVGSGTIGKFLDWTLKEEVDKLVVFCDEGDDGSVGDGEFLATTLGGREGPELECTV